MHVQVSPDAPFIVRAAVTSVLVTHIAAGCVALAAGAAALAFRKGGRRHRQAGTAFLAAMVVLLVIGAAVSPALPQTGNSFSAIFFLYLAVSGWLTVRRKDGGVGRAEIAAFCVALAVAPVLFAWGWMASHRPGGVLEGVAYQAFYIIGGMTAFAAALDAKVILSRGISGAQRIARHVWRICLSLTIAAFSFYPGQAQVFPAAIRRSPLLFAPVIVFLVLMVFWLLRIQFTDAFRPRVRRVPSKAAAS